MVKQRMSTFFGLLIMLVVGIFGVLGGAGFTPALAAEISSQDGILYLDQNWSEQLRQKFYFENQGSRLMPYDWFKFLEQADSEELFRADANMESFRYLSAPPSKLNPDGFPVGFAKDLDEKGQAWVGMTCAACHTAQLNYQGQPIRIDGGPTLADWQHMSVDMVAALRATSQNPDKFERFANQVLAAQPDDSSATRQSLKDDLQSQTAVLDHFNYVNFSDPKQPKYGFGRVDAIGAIFNQVMVTFDDEISNARPSNAPADYPFLWGTHQSDVVQWTAFAPNGPLGLGSMVRNGGEVLGVYGEIDIPESKLKITYPSSMEIVNLGKLEQWLESLDAPRWPESVLPPLNLAAAERGKKLYNQSCVTCHQVIAPNEQRMSYDAVKTPIAEVKTDPKEWLNMNRLLTAGKFEGRKLFGLLGPTIPAKTPGVDPLSNAVVAALLDQPLKTLEALFWINKDDLSTLAADLSGDEERDLKELLADLKPSDLSSDLQELVSTFQTNDSEQAVTLLKDKLAEFADLYQAAVPNKTSDESSLPKDAVYKARPLNGIWATAPYLHNGSVPNLYELLLPQAQRSQTFLLGSREFDPKKVGFVSKPGADGARFEFDTRLPGNSNAGHEYGTTLSNRDRSDLLAYLKTL